MGKMKKNPHECSPSTSHNSQVETTCGHQQVLSMRIAVYFCDGPRLSHKREHVPTDVTTGGTLKISCSVKEANHKGLHSMASFM